MLTDQLRCLVVVLVLDLLGFCADERADLPGNYIVPFVTVRILEDDFDPAGNETR